MIKNHETSKTETIYQLLKQRLADNRFTDNLLPNEPDLALELQVSRKTLRHALARLALENRIVRIKGKGTFINRQKERKGRILVLARDLEDITSPARYIFPAIQQEAETMNLEVECVDPILITSYPEVILDKIAQGPYCGILSFQLNFLGHEPIIGILKKMDLPVILVHGLRSDTENTGFAVMGTDYGQLIEDGLHYLAEQGHRRIAYLVYRELRISRNNYFRLLDKLGLDNSPELWCPLPHYNQHDLIMKGLEESLGNLRDRPTALFCFSDYAAVCVYEFLQKRRIRIPDDVAVLSIGNMIGCDFISPSLSALDFDCPEIGRQAVRFVMEMYTKKERTRPFLVSPHHLIERESTRKRVDCRRQMVPDEEKMAEKIYERC